MPTQPETYLGDGLYASYDGYYVRLRAPRLEGDHYISLEPDTYEALLAFVKKVRDDNTRERP